MFQRTWLSEDIALIKQIKLKVEGFYFRVGEVLPGSPDMWGFAVSQNVTAL